MVKNYILEAQRIIVHLCVCMYTANVLLLYYTDVPCLYCLALYSEWMSCTYNMIMAGKWYIVCYWMRVYCIFTLLWKCSASHFVQVNWTNEKFELEQINSRTYKTGQCSNSQFFGVMTLKFDFAAYRRLFANFGQSPTRIFT